MSALGHIGTALVALILTWLLYHFMVGASIGLLSPFGRFLRRTFRLRVDLRFIAAPLGLVAFALPFVLAITTLVTMIATRYFGTDGEFGLAILQYGGLAFLGLTVLAYTLGNIPAKGGQQSASILERRVMQHVKDDEEAGHPLFQMGAWASGVGHALLYGSKEEPEETTPSPAPLPAPAELPHDPDARTIGVIVVHGIGEQASGDTVNKIRAGLTHALAGTQEYHATWGKCGDADPCVQIADLKRELRFYEVHWADCLQDSAYGAFDLATIRELTWFPLINAGSWWRRVAGGTHTAVLLGVAGLLSIANSALDFARMFNVFRLFRSIWKGEAEEDDISALDPDFSWQRMEDAGCLPRRTKVDRLLDDIAGDIVTYVIAASHYRAQEGAVHEKHPAARIYQRFEEKLHAALGECDEVHVLAHSLGTIIAYHVLSQRPPNEKITDLYTIGSPLGKCLRLWPWLTTKPLTGQRIHWHNFSNVLDLVSNRRLGLDLGGQVDNYLLFEGGAVRSHIIYEWNRRFLRVFTGRTLGRDVVGSRGLAHRGITFIRGMLETLAFPLALTAAVGLGLVTIVISVLSGMLFYWLMAKAATAAGWPALGSWMLAVLVWLAVVSVVLELWHKVYTPRHVAERGHEALRNPPSDLLEVNYTEEIIDLDDD